jgi:hypothetical protein
LGTLTVDHQLSDRLEHAPDGALAAMQLVGNLVEIVSLKPEFERVARHRFKPVHDLFQLLRQRRSLKRRWLARLQVSLHAEQAIFAPEMVLPPGIALAGVIASDLVI